MQWLWALGIATGGLVLVVTSLLGFKFYHMRRDGARSGYANRTHESSTLVFLLCWMCDAFRPARDRYLSVKLTQLNTLRLPDVDAADDTATVVTAGVAMIYNCCAIPLSENGEKRYLRSPNVP